MVGSHPIQSIYVGIPTNVTIAASMAGTAAATQLSSSISISYAKSVRVFNLTGRNLELILGVGPDPGTADVTPGTPTVVGQGVMFCPGTATAVPGAGMGMVFPLAVNGGMKLFVRTTENTPITCASTTPLIIQFWV